MIGRPTKLTPEIAKALVDAVAMGMPEGRACDYAGVNYDTYLGWVARGEGRDPTRKACKPFDQFALDIKKARAADVGRRIRRIEQAAKGGAVVSRKTTKKSKDGAVVEETVDERLAAPCWTADAWHLERTDPENFGQFKLVIDEIRRELAELKKKQG